MPKQNLTPAQTRELAHIETLQADTRDAPGQRALLHTLSGSTHKRFKGNTKPLGAPFFTALHTLGQHNPALAMGYLVHGQTLSLFNKKPSALRKPFNNLLPAVITADPECAARAITKATTQRIMQGQEHTLQQPLLNCIAAGAKPGHLLSDSTLTIFNDKPARQELKAAIDTHLEAADNLGISPNLARYLTMFSQTLRKEVGGAPAANPFEANPEPAEVEVAEPAQCTLDAVA